MNYERNNQDTAEKIISRKYDGLINVQQTNKILEISKCDFKLSAKTLKNISHWALNGDSDKEIASNLEISEKDFQLLCAVCPALVMAMQESRQLAEIMLTGSLFQTAIGGQKIRKQQAVKMNDFDEDGNRIGEHIEIVEVEEELPPNPMLLKFLAEKKLNENFGESNKDKDNIIKQAISAFDTETLDKVKKLDFSEDK